MMKAFSFFISLILICALPSKSQTTKPNILVIFTDDHAQQAISAYGSKLMQTPNIDRIAKEGILFSNSFVTNSICAPSRAVLLTGKYSHMNGLVDNSPRRNFDGNQQQVQKILKEDHYQTAWIGKWHLQSLPQGFDYWKILPDQGNYFQPDFINMPNDTSRSKGYVTDLISDFSINWLNQRDKSQPFFLVVGEKATHRNWMPDIQDLGAFDDKDFPMPPNFFDDYKNRKAAEDQDMTISKTMVLGNDLKMHVNYQQPGMFGRMSTTEKAAYEKYYNKVAMEYEKIKNDSLAVVKWKYQRYLKDYLATARSLDRNIGRILKYLDSAGLTKNTLVVYTSDQGFYMGEHGWFDKRFMYEESMRTPLVMRFPGVIKAGSKDDHLVMNLDLAPTFINVAGHSVLDEMQGKSMLPLMKKEPLVKEWRHSMYYHYYEFPEPHHVSPHFGVRTEQYKLIRFYGPRDAWELFDLKKDKMEMKNLIDDAAYKDVVLRLKKELLDLANQFKDFEAVEIIQKQ
jgi:arylsulfatase A-like enzyme